MKNKSRYLFLLTVIAFVTAGIDGLAQNDLDDKGVTDLKRSEVAIVKNYRNAYIFNILDSLGRIRVNLKSYI